MVSIDSEYGHSGDPADTTQYGGHTTYSPGSAWPGSSAYSSAGTYAPLSVPSNPLPRTSSKSSRKSGYGSSFMQPVPESIEEESYDLSLLGSAAPMGTGLDRYAPIEEGEDDDDDGPAGPAFDITAALGPMTSHDEEFVKALQEQEAKGNLTGGLGQGFRPDTSIRDADLLSSPVMTQNNMARSFSRRRLSRRLGRAETIRHMGQEQANKRGEVIEVIMEEPAEADLSNMEGPGMMMLGDLHRSTFPVKEQMKQIFYPQPNWKPFSMQWPYLTMLVLLSVGLAVVQEILLQKYNKKNPLQKFTKPSDLAPWLYFSVKFGPTLSAVVYGVLWQFTDFEVRRLEAFYQLSKQGGALAAESLNVDYTTSFNFLRPFRALKKGHYAVALSSVATIFAVSLVPTFAAAAIVLSPSRKDRLSHPDGEKQLLFSAVWSRLLTSTLAVCAVAGCGLFYLLQTRRSGLLSDVRGIAGLASMAVVSHILMDFKDMDTAKHRDIHLKIKHNRYMLRNSSLAPDDENPVTSQEKAKYEDHHLPENPHPMMLRPVGSILFIFSLLLFMGFIPAFLFTPADVVTDKAPQVITALAVCLKLAWGAMETAVRMMEPYYILSKRHAPAKTLGLDYTALPFGYFPLRALLNGHILVFFVGFGSVMAEFLTILVSGLATVDGQEFIIAYNSKKAGKAHLINSGQETKMSFLVSLSMSVFILLYMSTVATIVFFRRRHPFLPRQPNTISSVLAFIHQSKMLYDFVGTEKMSSAQMMKRLGNKKVYGLGWFEGRDGQTHCGVDQEELISNYKHGIDFLQGNQPWNTQWDVL